MGYWGKNDEQSYFKLIFGHYMETVQTLRSGFNARQQKDSCYTEDTQKSMKKSTEVSEAH